MSTAAVAVGATAALPWYRNRPPVGHTGGFKEPTCEACHLGEPLNQSPGSIRLLGVPERYSPGQELSLTVLLTAPGLQVGGFQLTARLMDGRQAGRFDTPDARTALARAESGVEYPSHSSAGTRAARDTIQWQLKWIAPPGAPGDVVFHLAGNVANDDASPLGDRIYTGKTVLPAHLKNGKAVR